MIERLLSLDFKESPEATRFFSDIKTLSLKKVGELKSSKQEGIEKDLWHLEIIDQYCEYILNRDNPDYRVELKCDL